MKVVAGLVFPDADQFMCREVRPDGSYQADHLVAAIRFVSDRRCAVDGGAHIGQFSKPMAALFERVIAVEPAADSFECLRANLTKFGLTNVETRNVALGSDVGLVSMALDKKQAARGNTGGRYVVSGGTIPVERIDDWNLPHLGFLKLDVEGSEPFALAGAVETLKRCRPIVLFEDKAFWQRYGLPKFAPQDFLMGIGYRFLASVGRDAIWGPA